MLLFGFYLCIYLFSYIVLFLLLLRFSEVNFHGINLKAWMKYLHVFWQQQAWILALAGDFTFSVQYEKC
jgi:hypothetical protein